MTSDRRNTVLISALFLLATLFAFVVLDRWLVTDQGMFSYGRIWQFYASYADFGFVRRALIGSILTATGLNTLLANEYHFVLVVHHVVLVILSAIIAFYCISRKISDPVFLASVAFSPTLIIHAGYNTGTQDMFVLMLAAINILYTRNILLFCAIIVAGMLTHELFLFTIPAQFLALVCRGGGAGQSSVRMLALPAAALITATLAVTMFGTVDMPRETIEQIMRQKIPMAEGKHPLWSGYFEISTTPEQNAAWSFQKLAADLRSGLLYIIIPLGYVALVIARLWSWAARPLPAAAMGCAVLAPLLTSLVASDFYRWVAMSANMGILLALMMAAQSGRAASRWNGPLLALCLLAPFGGVSIQKPFPMHQFVLEKALR
jgi:hypothetical protein